MPVAFAAGRIANPLSPPPAVLVKLLFVLLLLLLLFLLNRRHNAPLFHLLDIICSRLHIIQAGQFQHNRICAQPPVQPAHKRHHLADGAALWQEWLWRGGGVNTGQGAGDVQERRYDVENGDEGCGTENGEEDLRHTSAVAVLVEERSVCGNEGGLRVLYPLPPLPPPLFVGGK